jgi:hypothetical protein
MINLPSSIPQQKRSLLNKLVARLSQVPHVAAVVLGGSYASGMQHSASDLDIGLYYLEALPFSVADIREIANSIASPGTAPTVTGFYEWGPWVNGGAWITTDAGKVDFLYRNLDQVQQTIEAARRGIVQHDYDQQPTSGFYSVGYLAETHICLPLYDPQSHLARLKDQVQVYPALLKQSVISGSLWGAEFTLVFARNYAAAADIYNTVGCLVRIAANLTQALFALNERYFLSDKKIMETLAAFRILPAEYAQHIRDILACPGQTSTELSRSVTQLERAWQSVVSLAGDLYRPRFALSTQPPRR